MKISNEFKTGMVVAAAIAVGVFFMAKTAPLKGKPYRLKVFFTYAEGIKADSIVKLSGIEVGRVEKIRFEYSPETKVELTLILDSAAKVREDSVAFISTTGFVGDAFVGLTPGGAGSQFAKEGATIASEEPIEARKIWKRSEVIMDNLDKALMEIKDLARSLTGAVKDNKPKIDNITSNLEAATANFKEFSDDVKKHPWKFLMKSK